MDKTFLHSLVILSGILALVMSVGDFESASATDKSAPTAVTLTLHSPLQRTERGALVEAGLSIDEYLGHNSYWALLPASISVPELQSNFPFVRSVEILSAQDKLAPELQRGTIPDHAWLPEGRVMIVVEFFKSAEDQAGGLLEQYSESPIYDEEAGAWRLNLMPEKLETLAAEPIVKRIHVAPDPRLLEKGTL